MDGIVKDNSLLRMLENSLTDGVLYRFRDPRTGEGDHESMLLLLKNFWSAVSSRLGRCVESPAASIATPSWGWGDHFGLPDGRNRGPALGRQHHAGVEVCPASGAPSRGMPVDTGYWEFGPRTQRKWNEFQNTSKDIQLLANYLLGEYRARVVVAS